MVAKLGTTELKKLFEYSTKLGRQGKSLDPNLWGMYILAIVGRIKTYKMTS